MNQANRKHNIKLIFTFHSEAGKYNAVSLCDAISSINPDVIFEELPRHYHAIAYKFRTSIAVEIDAVKKYLKHKVIDHIPVDTYELSDVYYKNENDRCKAISNVRDTREATELKLQTDNYRHLISQRGLPFLNSEENMLLFNRQQRLEYDILQQINDDRLLQFECERKEVIHNREYKIINNIYRYSECNQYKQAIMFIGCGHRSTILKVIEQFEIKEELKLNWSLY